MERDISDYDADGLVQSNRDMEQKIRETKTREAVYEGMKQDWFLLTGENMASTDLERLQRDWRFVHKTKSEMPLTHFERMKDSWSLLTKTMDSSQLQQLVQDLPPERLEQLKEDYLVLNWTRMSAKDHEVFKENWLKIAQISGVDSGKDIVKRWMLDSELRLNIRDMNLEDRVEFTRMCLERGADVNALDDKGNSLLLMIGGNYVPLVELLLSFGADPTIRSSITKETPLEMLRSYHYKDPEDVIRMLQIAEKAVKANRAKKLKAIPENSLEVSSEINSNGKRVSALKLNETTQLKRGRLDEDKSVETIQPPYLTKLTELFDDVDLDDIDDLMFRVINFMYVSRITRTELQFKSRVDKIEKIERMHDVFDWMCSELFFFFDPVFDRSINIRFGEDTVISESADLVFALDIHPEVEWVTLKLYAVPWDIEYCAYCKTSSVSTFSLGQKRQNSLGIYEKSNLIFDCEPFLGYYQRRLINWFREPNAI